MKETFNIREYRISYSREVTRDFDPTEYKNIRISREGDAEVIASVDTFCDDYSVKVPGREEVHTGSSKIVDAVLKGAGFPGWDEIEAAWERIQRSYEKDPMGDPSP